MAGDQLHHHILSLPWQGIDYTISYYQCHGRGSITGSHTIIALEWCRLQDHKLSLPWQGSVTRPHNIIAKAGDQLQDHVISLPWQGIDYRITFYHYHGWGRITGSNTVIAIARYRLHNHLISMPWQGIDYRITHCHCLSKGSNT